MGPLCVETRTAIGQHSGGRLQGLRAAANRRESGETRKNMSKNLVIVESPAKAKTINKYLGSDYTVEASLGHIMDLPKNDIGVELKKRTFLPNLIILTSM